MVSYARMSRHVEKDFPNSENNAGSIQTSADEQQKKPYSKQELQQESHANDCPPPLIGIVWYHLVANEVRV